jgi:hypothetical protein
MKIQNKSRQLCTPSKLYSVRGANFHDTLNWAQAKQTTSLKERFMKNALALLTIALLTFAGSISFAQTQQYSMNHLAGWYGENNGFNYNFAQATFVEKLHIEAIGHRNFQMAQVYADGEFVANLGVPGRDPYYPIVIRKKVSNIRIVFNGSIQIQKMWVDCNHSPFSGGLRSRDSESPAGLAESVMNVVAALQQTANPTQFNTYLLPLRKAAIRLAASGAGRPVLSTRTLARAQVMIAAINSAEGFLDELTYSDFYSDSVQTLLYVKEKLEAMYEIR